MFRCRWMAIMSLIVATSFALPAAAIAPDDHGNGNRVFRVEHDLFDTEFSIPVCEGGELTGSVNGIEGVYERTQTWFRKGDGSRIGFTLVLTMTADDGSFTWFMREKQTVNSIDQDGTGRPNAYNTHTRIVLSDVEGVYAERSYDRHAGWNAHGEPTGVIAPDPAWVCLRDAVVP